MAYPQQLDKTTIDELATRVAERQRPMTVQANRWAVVGNLDGRITLGDVIMALALLVAGVVGGLSMALIVWVANMFREPNVGDPTAWALNLSRIGVAVFIIRLVVDGLDLYSFWESSFGRAMERIADAKAERLLMPDPGTTIQITVPSENGNEYKILAFDVAQSERVIKFAKRYFDLVAQGVEYPTAEQFHVGSGLPWSNASSGEGGRPGWQSFWSEMVRAGMAYADNNGRRYLNRSGEWAMREAVKEAGELGL